MSYGFSNGRFVAGGKFTTTNRTDAQLRRDMADEDAIDAAMDGRVARNQQRDDAEVRGFYERLVGPTTTRFGTEYGRSMRDQEAFDRCVDEFGFRRAVLALEKLSARAGQLRPSLRGGR